MVVIATGCAASPGTATVSVGDDVVMTVEVARDAEAQRAGLSGRDDVAAGMLFIFDATQEQEVWMAGMELPLDVAWIAGDEVVEVRTVDPCRAVDQEQCPRWESPGVVDALLEVAAGELSSVEVGMTVAVSWLGVDSDGVVTCGGVRVAARRSR